MLDVRLMIEFITKKGFHMIDKYQAQEHTKQDWNQEKMRKNLVYSAELQLNVSSDSY